MAHNPHGNFPHHRLDVFVASKALVVAARKASDQVPRGYRTFADQLLRSAGGAYGGVVEGANRRTKGLKRDAFGRARAEAGEAAGWAELLGDLGLIPAKDAGEIVAVADRVAAMLTRLVQRFS